MSVNMRSLFTRAILAFAAIGIIALVPPADNKAQQAAMPRMDMGGHEAVSTNGPKETTPVMPDGYAEVRIAPDVQQRIGVTLGRVERTDLSMSIRAVGIVQPNETRVAHIHVKSAIQAREERALF